jgi:ABC-type phosphate transport system substrate-binding protein
MAAFATVAAARDVAVISGKSGAVQAVALPDLVKICSGKMAKWPDGRDIKIFISDPYSPGMKIVLEQIFNLNGGDVRAALQKVPGVKIVKSDQEVISSVAQVPGSIGFVDIYSINGTVAVIKIEGKLPLEPGYVLHKSQ